MLGSQCNALVSGGVPFWLDVAKASIGAFVGALFAFYINLHVRKIEKIDKQRAAGNAVLTVLSKQFGDFVIYKASTQREKAEYLGKFPGDPAWNHLKPSLFLFSDDSRIDLDSMTFLIDHGHADILEVLARADNAYHELSHLVKVHAAAARQKQEILAVAYANAGGQLTLEQMQHVLGRELMGRLDSFTNTIYRIIQSEQATYLAAGQSLHRELTRVFPGKRVMNFKPIGVSAMGISEVGLKDSDFCIAPSV